jgi:hypothetical protein
MEGIGECEPHYSGSMLLLRIESSATIYFHSDQLSSPKNDQAELIDSLPPIRLTIPSSSRLFLP